MKAASAIISVSLLVGSVAGVLNSEIVREKKSFVTGIFYPFEADSPDNYIFCAGALISPYHVLTSASCSEVGNVFAAIGGVYLNGTDGDVIKVTNVTIHPEYNSGNIDKDFSVFTLARASKHRPAKLPTSGDSGIRTGEIATVMCWGFNQGKKRSPVLRQLGQQLLGDKACIKASGISIHKSQVCGLGEGEENKLPFVGNSGCPLINSNDVLIGVYSASTGRNTSPVLYSRVPSILAWIDSIINA